MSKCTEHSYMYIHHTHGYRSGIRLSASVKNVLACKYIARTGTKVVLSVQNVLACEYIPPSGIQIVSVVVQIIPAGRFGKSTHISMISNSVTHLQSYNNSAIANIAGNSAR